MGLGAIPSSPHRIQWLLIQEALFAFQNLFDIIDFNELKSGAFWVSSETRLSVFSLSFGRGLLLSSSARHLSLCQVAKPNVQFILDSYQFI